MSALSAARIGKASLTLDWSGLQQTLGLRGIEGADTARLGQVLEQFKHSLNSPVGGAFYNAPIDDTLSQLQATIQLCSSSLKNRFKSCLFLGIGGSALGPLSALAALSRIRKPDLDFHFVENPDAMDWKKTLRDLTPESTLVVCVTKSGTTFETLSCFMCALDWLGRDRWSTHVVAVTDPERGDLRTFAQHEKIPTLPIAPSIGGRFSVFTPVGLLALELAGFSAARFLEGAAEVRAYLEKTPLEKNPFLSLAEILVQNEKAYPVHVCMPYSTALARVASWWVQLWAESLGKNGRGFTPVAALGAVDQHSLLQLLRDGPNDKITHVITIDQVADPVSIPRIQLKGAMTPALFSLLSGKTLQGLLTIEAQAMQRVLLANQRPHIVWRLDRLDEASLGALLFSMCVLTSLTAFRMGVNPFDQPGVEEAKRYILDGLKNLGTIASESDSHDTGHSAVSRLRGGENS